jgi:protein-tyrosine phosphatase
LFFFSKTKPVLKDLIENYVDIHSHLLPGIDDGSKDFDTTLKLIKALQDIGFSQFTATPHIIKNIWDNTRPEIEALAKNTITNLQDANAAVPFRAAAEYMMEDSFSKLLETEPLLTIKDNFVLVEMSYINPPMQLYDILFEIRLAGYQPVLAHPERYLFYHSNFEEYKKLKKAGCLLQLNLLSTVGYYGSNVANAAQQLLEKGLIDCTGSDVHHENHVKSFHKKTAVKATEALKEAIKNNEQFRF